MSEALPHPSGQDSHSVAEAIQNMANAMHNLRIEMIDGGADTAREVSDLYAPVDDAHTKLADPATKKEPATDTNEEEEPASLEIPDPHTDILGFFNFIRKVDETPVRLEAVKAHNEALAQKKASGAATKKELHEQPVEITLGDLMMQELAARRKVQREVDHAKRIKSLFQPDAEVVALQTQPLAELKRQADEKKRSDINEFNDVAARFRRRFAPEHDIEILVPYDKTKERKPGEKPVLVEQKGRMTYEIVKLTHGWILGKMKTNVDGGNSSQQDVVVLSEDGKTWYGATSEDRFEGRTIAVRGDGTFLESTLDYVADKARIDYILDRDTGAKYVYGARDFMKKKLGIA